MKDLGGRPSIDLDLEEFEKLSALSCTQAEIAGWFNIHPSTLEKKLASRKKLETKHGPMTLRQLYDIGQAKGRVSVRRKQMQLLDQGNATMAVWLGKQLLGQRDQIGLGSPTGGPLELISNVLAGADEAES